MINVDAAIARMQAMIASSGATPFRRMALTALETFPGGDTRYLHAILEETANEIRGQEGAMIGGEYEGITAADDAFIESIKE